MPNGRARQTNTRHANRQRAIQREQVVQASMVNPVIIEQAQQVIVEAQIVNVDELEAKIQELQARIITKENNVKRVKKELSKIKKETQQIIDNNDKLMSDLVKLDILEDTGIDSESRNFDGTNHVLRIKPTEMIMSKPDTKGETQNREIIQDYIKYLESIVMASSNGYKLMKITGGYEGFKNDKKHKRFLANMIAKSVSEDDAETFMKNNAKKLRDLDDLLVIISKGLLENVMDNVNSGKCELEFSDMYECGKAFLEEMEVDADKDIRDFVNEKKEQLLYSLKHTIIDMIKNKKQELKQKK